MFPCFFCILSLDTEIERAYHFIQDHRFNKEKKPIQCPLCNVNFIALLKHFDHFHVRNCVFCLAPHNAITEHVYCATLLEKAMQLYIQSIFDL